MVALSDPVISRSTFKKIRRLFPLFKSEDIECMGIKGDIEEINISMSYEPIFDLGSPKTAYFLTNPTLSTILIKRKGNLLETAHIKSHTQVPTRSTLGKHLPFFFKHGRQAFYFEGRSYWRFELSKPIDLSLNLPGRRGTQ